MRKSFLLDGDTFGVSRVGPAGPNFVSQTFVLKQNLNIFGHKRLENSNFSAGYPRYPVVISRYPVVISCRHIDKKHSGTLLVYVLSHLSDLRPLVPMEMCLKGSENMCCSIIYRFFLYFSTQDVFC